MPTYMSLLRYTDQGLRDVKESPARLEKARAAIQASGGEIKQVFLAIGQYDMVVISEAPNDQIFAATMLAIGSAGAVRSETLRIFNEEEYKEIIGSIP